MIARSFIEAVLIQKSLISMIEVAAMSDVELATYILALNGRVVVPTDEGKPTLH